MNSPLFAFTWEIWHKHRARLVMMMATLVAFTLFYPKLCALVGLNPNQTDALDQIASHIKPPAHPGSHLPFLLQILAVLFLLLGPLGCLFASQFYLIWIFTATQGDASKGVAFPARYFRLPVSTRFLAGFLMIGGIVSITLTHLAWTRLVHLPQIEVFSGYQNLLLWLTLLVLAQAIMWSLDGFAFTRLLVIVAAVWGLGFLGGPSLHDSPSIERNQTRILIGLLLIGGPLAFIGLDKIRHGSWQGVSWKSFRSWCRAPSISGPSTIAKSGLRVSRFSSAFRAQVWYEWRQQFRKPFFCVCALSGVPFFVSAVICLVTRQNLGAEELGNLTLYLLAIPLFVTSVFGLDPERAIPTFTAIRPLANGPFVSAKFVAVALGALLSWVFTAALIALLSLLGDMRAVLAGFPSVFRDHLLTWQVLPALIIGMIFLSWRFVVVDQCLGFVGKRWVSKALILKSYLAAAFIGTVMFLPRDSNQRNTLLTILTFSLASLLLLKFLFALWAFRKTLRDRLVSPSFLVKYLLIWTLLAATFLIPTLVTFHNAEWIVAGCLGILLILPLARIAFAPIALGMGRHR